MFSVYQVDAPKITAGALNFDGVNDNVDLGTGFTYQNFTVEMWVKPGATQNSWADIIDNNHVYTNNWAIQQDAATTNTYYCYMAGIGEMQRFTLTPDVWQHLALVKSPTQIIVYVNGTPVMTYNLPANFNISYVDNHLRLGNVYSSQYSDYRSWNGSLDEIKFWSRPLWSKTIEP